MGDLVGRIIRRRRYPKKRGTIVKIRGTHIHGKDALDWKHHVSISSNYNLPEILLL